MFLFVHKIDSKIVMDQSIERHQTAQNKGEERVKVLYSR